VVEHPIESLAGRWFDVRAVYQETNWAWTVWTGMKTVFLMIVTVGLSLLWYEEKRFCDIILFRRDDGSTVLRFDYDKVEDATHHLGWLRERLREEHVYDFCRDLGIPVNQVVGPGQDIDEAIEVGWAAVARSSRFS
jgi:hypothetical protein